MIEYVLGFCINSGVSHDEVLLIEKQKADWQHGKLNGIGRKIEPGESAEDAMRREFKEETQVDASEFSLRRFCIMGDERRWICHCFVMVGDVNGAQDCDEGRMVRVPPKQLPPNAIDNLHWLIPMAFAEVPVEAHVIEDR